MLVWQNNRLKLVMLVVVLAVVAVGAGLIGLQTTYAERIYPGVTVQGVSVGGLTVQEATSRLTERLTDPRDLGIELLVGEHTWRLSWADVGMRYDHQRTAEAAYDVGRREVWFQRMRLLAPIGARSLHHIEPEVIPPDPERIRSLLQRAAALVDVAPSEAELHLTAQAITGASGRAGHRLDVETGVTQVVTALMNRRQSVTLSLRVVPPKLNEPEPARSQASSLLLQPFILEADDPVTDYAEEFIATQEEVVRWLRPVTEHTGDSARLVLHVDEAAVRNWLSGVASQSGPQQELDVSETLTRTIAALESGRHVAIARFQHPEGIYVVQPGDNMFDIAYNHGFPLWRFTEANPDVDPEALEIGMQLTVPSLDVLLPEPIAPGKLIEINLTQQRLRAYQDGDLVFDFTCSTGMSSTPTIAGQFQVLFKEESAFAGRWSLDMPYFMAIYQEGPEFFNGIHELPITASGHRMWASALGWPASYGCVILDVGDAEALYNWAPVGTLVRIVGQAPRPVEPDVQPQEEMEVIEPPPPD
ncbi:MAG: L,D-transpeptidase family protein [Chloroflexi bacterium]|nr:L,D-transpeptidase family protein [Chloroflexota bacterium]